jgi:hypothetical protein
MSASAWAAQQIGTAELGRLIGVMHKPPPRAFIAALGDSNVQLRFNGWVDQRSHDYLMVRSEAIRLVKLALEAADMDMPEPIYRVQLTERAAAPADADPTQSPQATPQARSPRPARLHLSTRPVDTGVIDDLRPQIEAEAQVRGDTDLLDPSAPKE